MFTPLIGMPQGAEWLIILAIVILVFGAAKLPELARGTGQALRIFKTETKGLRDEDEKEKGDKAEKPAELTASEQERIAELERREAEIKAERERLSGN
ncbi:twin-arginine translocase TatA/TatE family subunit [Nocardioides sp. NBC_00850]|jgi:sec-independent protein translocase protein TatA|uniref:Sec-independent protein translocase protein TatA n=1 Tax=Nocardioides panzhihuensis TaxID=860243 RepID=A0A7Z0DLI8_9ACTN|nr:twin-arginine translocase TatA/TatE family subunit [Nocardioides panzhihuensis]NYI77640.1 sec-independent protein translocase protein TatA [Nocardioides panzhihuensis]WTA11336.1 twin-arginine translocase TatA/TatE family subunit [Nocardioides sp. NBC_00850]